MHMVIFASADGKQNFEQIEQLDEAIRFVERLRNEDGVTEAKLYELGEVPLSFKTYYQVEVGGVSKDAAPAVEAKPVTPAAPAAPVASPVASPAPAKAVTPPPAAKPAPPVAKPATAVPAAQSASADPGEKADASANGAGGRFGLFGKS
ncbi:MAG: hypothetical protein ACR2H3_05390 [Acidimicrobiales bacterium]